MAVLRGLAATCYAALRATCYAALRATCIEASVDSRYILDTIKKAQDDPWQRGSEEEEPEYLRGLERSLQVVAPPVVAQAEPITVAQARERIADAMDAYFEQTTPGHMLLIKALPGVGKTTVAVRKSEDLAAHGKRLLYAGPRHDFWHDVMAIAKHPDWWYEWQPRQAGDADAGKLQTCAHAERIGVWMARGYKAIDFCKRVCGWDYINDGCPYHAQKRRKEPIIFGQHQHITLGHPLEFSAVIGDECPLQAFMREWAIPGRWVCPPGMDPREPLAETLHTLGTLAETGAKLEGELLLQLLNGAERVLEACQTWTMPAHADYIVPEIHSPREVDDVPYAHLGELVPLLMREARAALSEEPYPHRILVQGGKVRMLLRYPVNPELPGRVAWLDATANPELYEACFRVRAKVVDARPRTAGRIYQVVDRQNGKASLLTLEGEATPKVDQLERQVARIIEENGYTHPAIITFQGVLEQTQAFRDLLHTHFYAARGTNALEEADALIVAGVPQPPLPSIEHEAKMIFFERMAPFARTFLTKLLSFNYIDEDGRGRAYPASGFYGDPQLNAVLWSLREAEIIQAAHRVRPINHPVDIWLLLNLPMDELPPDRLVTIRELFGAPEGVDAYLWPQVLEVGELCYRDHGAVTTTDLINRLGVSRPTAGKYIDWLIQEMDWEAAKAATKRSAGRPAKGARPKA